MEVNETKEEIKTIFLASMSTFTSRLLCFVTCFVVFCCAAYGAAKHTTKTRNKTN